MKPRRLILIRPPAPNGHLPESFAALVAEARKLERQRRRATARRRPFDQERQPCAGCGEPCRGHWCSDSCRIAEDGPQPGEMEEAA